MTLNAHDSNHELLRAISSGDHAAFNLLFEQFHSPLLKTAIKWSKSRHAAEDIVQDTFLGIWKSREGLANIQDPAAYIYTSLFHTINRWLRQPANRQTILMMEWPEHTDNNTEELILRNDSRRVISEALTQLTPQKQLIYRLKKEEGRTHEEIADMLHLSPHTVKGYLKEAVSFIRNYLKNAAISLVFFVLVL